MRAGLSVGLLQADEIPILVRRGNEGRGLRWAAHGEAEGQTRACGFILVAEGPSGSWTTDLPSLQLSDFSGKWR